MKINLFFLALILSLSATSSLSNAQTKKEYFGHLIYKEADNHDLITFKNVNKTYQIQKSAQQPLINMMKSAKKDHVNLIIISAFRNVTRQNYLFYGIAKKRGQTLKKRAEVSAPPGFSEHHTGFTFDFDDGDTPVNLEEEFADTKAGKWIAKNGHKYGFELSFPKNNAQGVLFEPWHWRWVGNQTTCKIFNAARQKYTKSKKVICSNNQNH